MSQTKRKWQTPGADGRSDEVILGDLFAQGLTDAEIGAQIGRSAEAVKKRRHKLGLSRTYTLSERAHAQRITARVVDGRQAKHPLNQLGPPCKRSHCPHPGKDGKGCDIKRDAERKGKGIVTCPALAVDPQTVSAFQSALTHGDLSGLVHLRAMMLAGTSHVALQGLEKVLEEGLAVEKVTVGEYGGKTRDRKGNPRAYLTLKYLEAAGGTADQNLATPASRGRSEREDEALDLWQDMARAYRETQESQRFGTSALDAGYVVELEDDETDGSGR